MEKNEGIGADNVDATEGFAGRQGGVVAAREDSEVEASGGEAFGDEAGVLAEAADIRVVIVEHRQDAAVGDGRHENQGLSHNRRAHRFAGRRGDGVEIRKLQEHWNRLGEKDAMWAILTEEGREGGGWAEEEFFETGRVLIGGVMEEMERLGLRGARGRALDFGCGVGRLTQALAGHFDEVVGVDIGPSLVEQARRFNRAGERCRYVVNGAADLRQFEDGAFDFVFTTIVLQHMKTEYACGYVEELLRVLRPGGVAAIQAPDRPAGTAVGLALRVVPNWVVRPLRKMDMYAVPRWRVEEIVRGAGCELEAAVENGESGRNWKAYRYWVKKRG